jgi:hypothetical protein
MNYFTELNIDSKASQNLLDKIENLDESKWIRARQQTVYLLNKKDFDLDPEIVKIIDKFSGEKRMAFLKLPPNTCYGWHQDVSRQASINMLIKGVNSMCIFGTKSIEEQFINLKKLEYKKNRYYLMDVTNPHTVFNFEEEERFVITISIAEASYIEIRNYLIENNLCSID